jgi:glycosyltransferase involved in cell wall biosynthesis
MNESKCESTNQKSRITGVVITYNEETKIRDCILSLKKVCNEIVVVDSESSDRTCAIAEELGARVIIQKYLGDGPQKNLAAKNASNDWVLSIDADERLSDEMADEIRKLEFSDVIDAYGFPRKNYIGDRWIRHCGWYPDICVRLFNQRKVNWSTALMHAYVEVLNYQIMKGHIIHHSYQCIEELFIKADRYSTAVAKSKYKKGIRVGIFSPILHGLTAFVVHYIFRLGFLDGVDGVTICLSAGFNSYLKYAKLIEFQRNPELTKDRRFEDIW